MGEKMAIEKYIYVCMCIYISVCVCETISQDISRNRSISKISSQARGPLISTHVRTWFFKSKLHRWQGQLLLLQVRRPIGLCPRQGQLRQGCLEGRRANGGSQQLLGAHLGKLKNDVKSG